jgi:hypothetical protein
MTQLDYESPQSRVRGPVRILWLVLLVWTPFSVSAMMFGWYGCVRYNSIAGTDITTGQMVLIAVSMNTGPFVGPLQGRDAFNGFYGELIPVAVGVFVLGWVPTLLVRRPLHFGWRMAFVVLHLGVAGAWYFAAVLSLAYHLE